jgi:hypothetical protein
MRRKWTWQVGCRLKLGLAFDYIEQLCTLGESIVFRQLCHGSLLVSVLKFAGSVHIPLHSISMCFVTSATASRFARRFFSLSLPL